jgi:hypothetical protein
VQVVVSMRARSDLLNIHSYLSERSLVAADPNGCPVSSSDSMNCASFHFRGPPRSELGASLRGLLMDGYIASTLWKRIRL